MKPFQFGISTILLVFAFFAIAIAGSITARGQLQAHEQRTLYASHLLRGMAIMSPLWAPIAVASYVIARRRLIVLHVAVFTAIEVAALFIAWLSYP